jgi:histidyl-tRNA synthetase
MSRITAPKGTVDIFYPEVVKWQYLEDQIRTFYARFLYREIRTPLFEHSELFLRGIGDQTEVVQKEMYTFDDKGSRSLTLRPENTASVVRAAIENNLWDQVFPLRFFYIGPMFRYEKPQKGRQRQFHQFGIEVFGDSSPQVDAEVVYSAYRFLIGLDIRDIQVHINSVGCCQCRPAFVEALKAAALKEEADLCPDCRRKVHTNPLRIFDCKNPQCIGASDRFPAITDYLCAGCRDHHAAFKAALQVLAVPSRENSRLVRGLDYYTHTTFEITSGQLGAQNAVLGGGRYNNLVKELGGADVPGIGFAAGMERIILHLGDTPHLGHRQKIILVAYQDPGIELQALQLCARLWEKGITAYMDYGASQLKKQFKKGDRLKADFTFILGQEEIAGHTLSIKRMETREQIAIKEEDLDQWLKQNI